MHFCKWSSSLAKMCVCVWECVNARVCTAISDFRGWGWFFPIFNNRFMYNVIKSQSLLNLFKVSNLLCWFHLAYSTYIGIIFRKSYFRQNHCIKSHFRQDVFRKLHFSTNCLSKVIFLTYRSSKVIFSTKSYRKS